MIPSIEYEEVLVGYPIIEYEVKRPILTYYFDHRHRLIKDTAALHSNSAVQTALNNMRNDYYEGAVSCQVFDCTTARLYADIKKTKSGEVRCKDFQDPRNNYDPIHRKYLPPRTGLALIPKEELR